MNAKPIPPMHPTYIQKDGKIESVTLPFEEYLAIKEFLEEFEDSRDLVEAETENAGADTLSWDAVKAGAGRD